jgi:hypothetical protein
MKAFTALSALIALAAAQTTSNDLSEPTQSLDIEPTPTSSAFDDIESSLRVKKRDPKALPLHLENPRDHTFKGTFATQRGSVPLF